MAAARSALHLVRVSSHQSPLPFPPLPAANYLRHHSPAQTPQPPATPRSSAASADPADGGPALLHEATASVLDVLRLEEGLLREDDRSWCVVFDGVATPTVVMGISGKPDELLDVARVRDEAVPVVKRFSGGGTVVLNAGSLLVGFVCNKEDIGFSKLFPRELMEWTAEELYRPAMRRFLPTEAADSFNLAGHDYALGDKKIGGNAQSFSRDRFVHHTSFLWDYDDDLMELLTLPKDRPEYRGSRPHSEFVTRIKDSVGNDVEGVDRGMHHMIDGVLEQLDTMFDLREVSVDEAVDVASTSLKRQSNKIILL